MSETEVYLAFAEKSGASPEQASVTEAKERLLWNGGTFVVQTA